MTFHRSKAVRTAVSTTRTGGVQPFPSRPDGCSHPPVWTVASMPLGTCYPRITVVRDLIQKIAAAPLDVLRRVVDHGHEAVQIHVSRRAGRSVDYATTLISTGVPVGESQSFYETWSFIQVEEWWRLPMVV